MTYYQLFTWGYTDSTPDGLRQYVTTLDALLVDIRMSAWSRVPRWRVGALMELVGPERYRHVQALGNIGYREGYIELLAPHAGLLEVAALLEQRACIFLCGCKDWRICHRKVAAELVQQALGVEVEHLPGRFSDWGGAGKEGQR